MYEAAAKNSFRCMLGLNTSQDLPEGLMDFYRKYRKRKDLLGINGSSPEGFIVVLTMFEAKNGSIPQEFKKSPEEKKEEMALKALNAEGKEKEIEEKNKEEPEEESKEEPDKSDEPEFEDGDKVSTKFKGTMCEGTYRKSMGSGMCAVDIVGDEDYDYRKVKLSDTKLIDRD